MDVLMKLSRDVQVVLGGALLYVIVSFFDWQSASGGSGIYTYSVGFNEWHSFIGLLAGLIALLLLAWELSRAFDIKVPTGSLTPGLVSAGLAGLLLLLTVIIFLDWSDYRAWPEFVGLILALVIGGFAFKRARDEGVEMPNLPKNTGMMGGGSGTSGGMGSGGGPSGGGPAGDSPDSGGGS